MSKITSLFLVVCLTFGAAFVASAQSTDNDNSPPANNVVASININTADAQTLADNLYRVGIKKAEAIVMWREANGEFTSIEQLLEVKGIGDAILAANAERIRLK